MIRVLGVLTISLLVFLCQGAPLSQEVQSKPQTINDHQGERLAGRQATFLSDTDPAYAYLESIQKRAYARDPQAFRWTNDEKQKQVLMSLLAELDSMDTSSIDPKSEHSYSSLYNGFVSVLNSPVPTRYEDPNSLAILASIVRNVEAITSHSVPQSSRPRFGTLPAGTLNARTVIVPDSNRRLTVLNSGLFSFCYEYFKVGLKTVIFKVEGENLLMDYGDQAFEQGAMQDKELMVRLSKLFEDAVNHRRIRGQQRPSPAEAPLLMPMTNAMEFFLVAHEYGHIALGHVSSKEDAVHIYGVNKPLSAVRRTWGQEAAADAYAFSLLDKYLSSESAKDEVHHAGVDLRQFLRLAPLFFFVFNSSVEDMQYLFDNKKLPSTLSDKDKALVVDYLDSALSDETKSRGGSVPVQHSRRSYDAAVISVLNGDYPPPWARLALMERYLQKNSGPTAASTDLAFRDLGLAVIAHLKIMQSDLMPAWVSILQKTKTQP
jgi:hypothetical protein